MTFDEIVNLLTGNFGEEVVVGTTTNSLQPSVTIAANAIVKVAQFLFEDERLFFDYLACITGLDNGPQVNTMEVIYNFTSIPYGHDLMVKVMLTRNQPDEALPSIDSLSSIWKTADWHEREAYDLLGINFTNHPDLRRILLPADWEGYPLRKDYNAQEVYHGIRVNYEDRDKPDS
jgi:NADH-quinone oxidoreductase subunit C